MLRQSVQQTLQQTAQKVTGHTLAYDEEEDALETVVDMKEIREEYAKKLSRREKKNRQSMRAPEGVHVEPELVIPLQHQASGMEKLMAQMTFAGGRPWVEHILFDIVIGICIATNTLIIGMEVDMDLGVTGEVIKNVTVIVWLFEAAAKICTYGCSCYFRKATNLFDFALAVLGALDLWIVPFFEESSGLVNSVTAVRVFRLIRLIRLVRLVRFCEELWVLVLGLMNASTALFWVLILLLVEIYAFAILFTLVVGKECDSASGPFAEWIECSEYYGSMFRSMHTLFEIMTLDMGPVRPMIIAMPWLEIPIIAFVMTTSFGLLNIIMGVIVDQVLEFKQNNKVTSDKKFEKQHLFEMEMLRNIFLSADGDDDGYVTIAEFTQICERPDVQAFFDELGIPVSRSRLAQRLFNVFDAESAGRMDVGTFVLRTDMLLREGRLISKDATLLLMDVRSLDRRFDHLETTVQLGMQAIMDSLSSFEVRRSKVTDGNREDTDEMIRDKVS